jgi:hypothetical protein
MMKNTYYFHWLGNLINMLWWKLLILFGVRRSALLIPEGMYCYSPDVGKNKAKKDFSTYYVNPCKYYKTLGRRYNGCSYLGIITDDMIFDDQCKMCGENYGDEDE